MNRMTKATAGFADHFSAQAEGYARYRPGYPPQLFAGLAALAPSRRVAWDCATGSGQAAWGLAAHFEQVLASDPSAAQLAGTRPHPRIHYTQARAESPGIHDASLDLITVAQALHWFDLDAFYGEARRLLRPGGVLAVWSYRLLRIGPKLDPLLDRLDREIVGPYWPAERRLVDNGYRELAFPFRPIEPPAVEMTADWDLSQVLGYLGTWSSVRRYREQLGADPLAGLRPEFEGAWGDPATRRRVHWPLTLRVGRRD